MKPPPIRDQSESSQISQSQGFFSKLLGVEIMEFRQLGRSGLKVSVLSLGTMTFGGKGAFAKTGSTDIEGARRQIDLCLDAGINLFHTADVYSAGLSELGMGRTMPDCRDFI
jgi:aryl-alcohol dehydrogenase-like predicted oxidoreductase